MKLLTAIGQDMLREFSSLLSQYSIFGEQALIRYKAAAPWKSTILHYYSRSLTYPQSTPRGPVKPIGCDLKYVGLTSFISRTALQLLLQRFWCLLEAFSFGSGFRSNEKLYYFPLFLVYRFGWFGRKGSIVSYIPPPARGRPHPPDFP